MRSILFFTFILCSQQLSAQTFTEVPPAPPFDRVENSSIAFSDVDGDDDDDVLITGQNSSGEFIAKLYTNDGQGNFSEMTGTPFDGVEGSSIAFSDVDGDNDQDILITGLNSSSGRIAKLYTNDGQGYFSEMTGTPFEGVNGGSIAFSDVDGDNDNDVLITGYNSSGAIAKLYTNDGQGNFSEMTGTPFDAAAKSSIAFSDVDGDNDNDVLITGQNSSGELIAKLYTNDGQGNFSEMGGTPFDGVDYSSIAFSDVDGDNDDDVLITGLNSSGELIAKLYTNDGQGYFSEMGGTPFEAVYGSSIAFSDVDGDNDNDVLITGQNSSGEFIAKLYTNDGQGYFSEMTGTPFEGVAGGSIAFSNVDGDNDNDILVTGLNDFGAQISKLYTNDGQGNFSEMRGTPFEAVYGSSIAFSDVDGDNDNDVLITGQNSSETQIAKLYTNDGQGNFSEITGTPFDAVYVSSIAFSDVDGDNDEDVLITGFNNSDNPIAKLYTNDGLGYFSETTGTPFDAVEQSSIAFSDVDGDNDNDVLITGYNSLGEPIAKLYNNDGQGNFSEMTGTPFDGAAKSSIAFSDVDGDNDNDVLITGLNSSGEPIAKLYTNDGQGNFSEMGGTPFEGIYQSSIAFSDVDGDNDNDVLITGQNSSGDRIAKLYTNDGQSNFSEMTGTPFEAVDVSSIAFSDVDGDNDNDILITGLNSSSGRIAKLYTNDGIGNYSEMTGTPFEAVYGSSIAFSDVDGDNDNDVLITGVNSSGEPIAKLYTNDGSVSSVADVSKVLSFEFVFYPNPTGAHLVNLNILSKENGLVSINVIDLYGRLLSRQQEQIGIGAQAFLLDISSLNKGTYIIQLDDGVRKSVQKLLIH